ncbi:unnamed protein product, partial [marine sediment metagenome]
ESYTDLDLLLCFVDCLFRKDNRIALKKNLELR